MNNYSIELKNISKRFGDFVAVDAISLQIEEGEFFSLLGPSGCGKTTTLRMIAGFEQPSQGQIYLKGEPVAHLPPFKRNVNTVFQDYALFPHMTVDQNVGFSLDIRDTTKSERDTRVDQVLEMVHLTHLQDRRPSQLSGGQQQRVALARAVVNQPDVLLLDEPLSALDLKLRQAMRLELKQLQRQLGITFIFVTHDQEEALFMSDRIAVMDKGQVAQVGSPDEIYDRPVNRYVADFIGETNFLECAVLAVEPGAATVQVGEQQPWRVACDIPNARAGASGVVIVRPEKVDIHVRVPEKSEQTITAAGAILDKVWIGTDTHFTVALDGGGQVRVRHQNMVIGDPVIGLRTGDRVQVSWQWEAARLLVD